MATTIDWHLFDRCHKCGVAQGEQCQSVEGACRTLKRAHDNRPRIIQLGSYDGMCLATVPYRGLRLMCTLAKSHRVKGIEHSNGTRRWAVAA